MTGCRRTPACPSAGRSRSTGTARRRCRRTATARRPGSAPPSRSPRCRGSHRNSSKQRSSRRRPQILNRAPAGSRSHPPAEDCRPQIRAADSAPRAGVAHSVRTQRAARGGLESEDPDDSSLTRMASQIGREVCGRPDVGGIVGSHVAGEQEPVAADPGVDGDVLLAVRAAKRNRRANDTRADLELPELAAGARVRCLEPAVERAVKHHVTGGDDAAAPDGKLLLDLPDLASRAASHAMNEPMLPPGPAVYGVVAPMYGVPGMRVTGTAW